MNSMIARTMLLIALSAVPSLAAQTQQQVQNAASCLATKQFLEPYSKSDRTLGAFLDEVSYPGEKVIYVLDYSTADRRKGFEYAVFMTHENGRNLYDIQNNVGFQVVRGAEPIEFTTPPLGGSWTQARLVHAIREARRRRTFKFSAGSRIQEDQIECQAYTDAQRN